MASVSSEGWDYTIDDIPVIEDSLLMDLLDQDSHVDETEDDRLGCVIRSLQAEIDCDGTIGDGCDPITPDRQSDHATGIGDGGDCSRSMSPWIDDPFDWVDMDMVSESQCCDMGSWYFDTCTDEIGMAGGFGDGRDYSHLYYGGDCSMEQQVYSPLWQDT